MMKDERIILSQYWSDDESITSIVEKDCDTNKFYVRQKSAFGSWFTCVFLNEEEAEQYAEEWVGK